MARPGPVRPARPARWFADAWLMRATWRVGRPDQGEWLATRASPLSTTLANFDPCQLSGPLGEGQSVPQPAGDILENRYVPY